MKEKKSKGIIYALIAGGILVVGIFIAGTFFNGLRAKNDIDNASKSVSLLYLDELAGRREQVVSNTLKNNINTMYTAISLMEPEDLSSVESLQDYQKKMKQMYNLEKYAFVDSEGLIYTSLGTRNDIVDYDFDYNNISEPEISIKKETDGSKKVIIAVPTEGISLEGKPLVVCFMEMNMDNLLQIVSLQSDNNNTTFCNIYTKNGDALTDMILGGLASEDNLLQAMGRAKLDPGYSIDEFYSEFRNGKKGVVSFTYGDVKEILSYVPIEGTDWMLTYLIRENVISNQINSISRGIIFRNLIQTIITTLVIVGMFIIIFVQTRKMTKVTLDKEKAEIENKVKQSELEDKLVLQEKLLEQERERTEQDSMITALASDYNSVYYVSLDTGKGICYRSDSRDSGFLKRGDDFDFAEAFTKYADEIVAESYREDFKRFIEPENIRKALENETIIVYRYLTVRGNVETYEMLRMAGVRRAENRDDHIVHAVGVGFTDIDSEMRESLAKNQALSDALNVAENANNAKTSFLSNMSHEIRTPMNAIIGLDNIALSDPDISPKTREYLEKIGSSAEHLLGIINDILDMSRIESGKMILNNEEFSFMKFLEQINTLFSIQCMDKGLNYNCYIKDDIDDEYVGDSTKLRQVIVNILSNAVKFTDEGGNINLSVKKMAQFDGKSSIQFIIEDTGIGMSEEFLPKIFDSFTQEDSTATNKYGSSGLGLAIAKNIVEMMNGNIEVESEKGTGTTFRVTVTLMDAEKTKVPKELIPDEMCVLVIDDDPVACENAKLVLEKVGIYTEIALSGEEGVEMVRLRHARREPYNLILVDWQMPDMDGVETTKKIRSIIGSESAIIILTAYNWDDIFEEAVNAGVDTFMAKPLFASNVMGEFNDAVEKRKSIKEGSEVKADLKGRHILLAEDMQVNAEIMMMVLEMREMKVDIAENGRIALDKFRESSVGYYDAILMDMRMPEMDGLEATGAIRDLDREDAKSIPIIALTANAFDEDVQRSLQAGLNAHLSKPVQPELLYDTLESLISK